MKDIRLSNAKSIDGWMSDRELKFLAESVQEAEIVIEIGCHKGRSTRALADNCPGTVYAIDPWKGVYFTNDNRRLFESGDHIFTEFVKNLRYCGNVMVCRGTLEDFFLKLPQADFIFIDGDHRYEYVKKDILLSQQLLKPMGTIAGHDYRDRSWPGVEKAVTETFGNRVKTYDTIWFVESI